MSSPSDILGQAIVLDGSILLNLVATPRPRVVLEALGTPFVLADVAKELTRCPRTGSPSSPIDALIGNPLQQVDIEDEDAERFIELLSAGPSEELADSEAATIAYATRRGLTVASDEPRVHRVLARRFMSSCLTTADLYRVLLEEHRLERSQVSDFLFDSLRIAHMQVTPGDLEWSRSLLTPSQLDQCRILLRV